MGNDIGRRVRAAREVAGLTIEKLAYRSGLSVATVARTEKGTHLPTTRTLQAIAAVLDVPWSRLADGGEPASPQTDEPAA